MDKLKDCPFCGNECFVMGDGINEGCKVVVCSGCMARIIGCRDEESAVKQWNSRVLPKK